MLRIGDFSRISRVPIKTLRYYDEIGVFRPADVDPFTGYRLYAMTQLPALNRILALRDLGFSLNQIDRLKDSAQPTAMIREMLATRRDDLREHVREETERLARVEARLRLIEQEEHTMLAYDVILKDVPSLTTVTAREIIGDISHYSASVNALTSIVFRAMHEQGWEQVGPPMIIGHDQVYTETDIDSEIVVPVNATATDTTSPPSDSIARVRILPGGTMATVIVRGNPSEVMGAGYAALGAWIAENNYRIIGSPREVYLSKPDDSGEPIAEIQYPVAK